MPNDLGQPLKGRSEIIADLNMIYRTTSQKEQCPGFDLRLSMAENR